MAKNYLNLTYNWFDDTIKKSVENSITDFFENKYEVMLASISENENLKENPLLKNELFYSCQISIKNKQFITSRATSDFIRIVFHDIFGSRGPVFNLEELSELEIKILNSFFEFVIKGLEKYLIAEADTGKIDPSNKTNLSFVFLIKNKEVNSGKINLSIPLNRITPEEIKPVENFVYDDFINNFAYVDLKTGCAKISLDELKNLSKDDIIVLENSDIKKMTLKTLFIEHEFKVNPEPSIMIDTEEEGEGEESYDNNNYKESVMSDSKTMWDDIQIEVCAEFKKVKMTLGDLKQISKGLVIDLGPIMNNEISLLVENKTVAKGELVIINDKYGVKINRVFATTNDEDETSDMEAKKQTMQNEPSNHNPQNQKAQSSPQPPQRPVGARPQGAPPQRPQAQAPNQPPQRPVGARPQGAPPQRPQAQAPNQPPQRPQGNNGASKKEDFDYSNFEE